MFVITILLFIAVVVLVIGLFLLVRAMNAIHLDVCQIRAWLGVEMEERKRRAKEAECEAKMQALIQRYNVPEEWLRDPESILFDVLSNPDMPEQTKLDTITFEGMHLIRKEREARQPQSSEPSSPVTPVPSQSVQDGQSGVKK